jgi:hypothetical protein
MSLSTSDVISRFDSLEEALKSVFPKVDPRSVVGLILHEKKEKNPLYTLETIIKPGQNTDSIKEVITKVTGMVPGFYLTGTKIVVTHKLSLELLKRINDLDYVVSIKAAPYSAAASSDF